MNKTPLCSFNRYQGCASKLRKTLLQEIVQNLPNKTLIDGIISSYDSFDDAAIYQINEQTSIVFTIDFITPVTNDPEKFGEIAVANALSDIFAKGATPTLGLNILCFPQDKMELSMVNDILKGGYKKATEANAQIVGGHTLNISEIIYGLAAIGFVNNDKIILNSGAQENDVLILTKPLGTNVILTLINKMNYPLESEILDECLDSMRQLNKTASAIMNEVGVNACVDVSGYGFIGHLSQMLEASHQKARIEANNIPVISKSLELLEMAFHQCSMEINKSDYENKVKFSSSVAPNLRNILFDAHTSGGLLISVPEEKSQQLIEKLHSNNIPQACIVGKVVNTRSQEEVITVI